jgi:hypothetical protein
MMKIGNESIPLEIPTPKQHPNPISFTHSHPKKKFAMTQIQRNISHPGKSASFGWSIT